MKKILILVSLFMVLFASAQTQDTLYVWKAGVLVNIQSVKTVDMDSITFKRPPVNPNGINIAGPNVTDIEIIDENTALNVMVSFLHLAQKRGAFNLQESAKAWECVKVFMRH